ncbi:hypothetical protein E2C01_100287 [Portunus trituberculatus]|uniref:Pro-resilin n=1 Tax=Portunus trituberculatus TaxID=210409 RepID=A0A5B7K6F2_PORTR|nr:hypothetical protein [Portunus trituberculatus]
MKQQLKKEKIRAQKETTVLYSWSLPITLHLIASQDTAPSYNFDYAVKDYLGNDFGHQESRDGYDTQGSYYVQLPDSRLQEVKYTVSGDSGFLADVTYQGEAQYPAYKPAHKPIHEPATSYQPVSGYA